MMTIPPHAFIEAQRGDQKGPWARETAGTIGLVQRADIGPTVRAGFRNGLKGLQPFWPKSGPDRRTNTQKATAGRKTKMRKEG